MKKLLKKVIFWKVQFLAKLVLKKYKPQIIAITGSVGKTSAKDAIDIAMSTALYTRKSQKSYNSDIGIPLVILGCDSGWGSAWKWTKIIFEGFLLVILPNIYPKWLIIEAGIETPGDMEKTARLIESDVIVFTKFSKIPVHVEFFDSPEAVITEKKKLLKSLKKGGVLVLNADDTEILKLKEGSGKHAVTYGFSNESNVKADNLEIIYEDERAVGISFKVNINGGSFPVLLKGVLGKQHAYPILSALAVGVALKLNAVKITDSFRHYMSAPGRMRILDGAYGSTIIDDSYNSSPIAVESALEVLKGIVGGRKIAVLGDMMELGKYMEHEHKVVGEIVYESADVLITVGKRAQHIKEGAQGEGMAGGDIHSFKNSIEAGEFLKGFIKKGDIVLIKGSQSPRLEKVVAKILARPEEAKFLLVRQEKEWENR